MKKLEALKTIASEMGYDLIPFDEEKKEILYKFPELFNRKQAFVFDEGCICYNSYSKSYIIYKRQKPIEKKYKITCEEFDKPKIGQWYVNNEDDYMPILVISKERGLYYDKEYKKIVFCDLKEEELKYKLVFHD